MSLRIASPVQFATVRTVVARRLDYLKRLVDRGKFSADGFLNTTKDLERFAIEFGNEEAESLRQHEFNHWFRLQDHWKAASTRKRVVAEILACLNWAAYDEEMIARNPIKRPRDLKHETEPLGFAADVDVYNMLLTKANNVMKLAIMFLRFTGARTGEMRNLTWDQVHLDGDAQHIQLDRHKTVNKTNQPRIIGLDTNAVALLSGMLAERKWAINIVFTNSDGCQWTRRAWCKSFQRLSERCGFEKLTAYSLRRGYVCDAIEAGVSTRQIADQVGHATTHEIDTRYGATTKFKISHVSKVAREIGDKRA